MHIHACQPCPQEHPAFFYIFNDCMAILKTASKNLN